MTADELVQTLTTREIAELRAMDLSPETRLALDVEWSWRQLLDILRKAQA